MFIYFHRYNHIPTRNACGVALSPDEFEQTIIARATADCESSNSEFSCTCIIFLEIIASHS